MIQRSIFILLIFLLPFGSEAQLTQQLLNSSVFVEAFDSEGNRLALGTGVILKKGAVLTNYHVIAGAHTVKVTSNETKTVFESNGFFSADETVDMIALSVPGLNGAGARFSGEDLDFDSARVRMVENPLKKEIDFRFGNYKGLRAINDIPLMEVISAEAEECTGGMLWYGDLIYGMVVAGFLENKYSLYAIPISQILPKLRFSPIIKSFESIQDGAFAKHSIQQEALMESITSVIWRSFEQAVDLAQKKQKKILLSINATWCGWCKIMDKNTYSDKGIIRFINDHYYAVSLDGEGQDTITFAGKPFIYDQRTRSHELAYLLLDGNMSYPATVFLDDEINLLTVVPGYVKTDKMSVILHYFKENAYLDERLSFEQYEQSFEAPDRGN